MNPSRVEHYSSPPVQKNGDAVDRCVECYSKCQDHSAHKAGCSCCKGAAEQVKLVLAHGQEANSPGTDRDLPSSMCRQQRHCLDPIRDRTASLHAHSDRGTVGRKRLRRLGTHNRLCFGDVEYFSSIFGRRSSEVKRPADEESQNVALWAEEWGDIGKSGGRKMRISFRIGLEDLNRTLNRTSGTMRTRVSGSRTVLITIDQERQNC